MHYEGAFDEGSARVFCREAHCTAMVNSFRMQCDGRKSNAEVSARQTCDQGGDKVSCSGVVQRLKSWQAGG